jgi:hypothetical protein
MDNRHFWLHQKNEKKNQRNEKEKKKYIRKIFTMSSTC